jgi:DHA1 family multidrug resistance protein-like MFS transporter
MHFFKRISKNLNYRKNAIIDILKSDSEDNEWKRNLAFISLAQFMTMAGMSSAIPFLPLYVRELGITDPESAKLWSGFIFSGPYMLSIIATPIWGSIGDKYGRKPMIIRALFGLTFAVGLMGFVQNVYQLLALRIFQGAVSGMIASALGFVSANTPEHRSGYAIGILQTSLSAGNIFGPFIGGIISDAFGIRNVFYIVSALCFISGVLIMFFVREKSKGKYDKNKFALVGNVRYVFKNKEIFKIMLLILLAQGGINYTNPIFPYFVEELGAPQKYLSSITGSLFAIIGFFSIMFAPTWGRRNDKKHYAKTIRISTTIIAIAGILHIFMPSYLYLFPLRAIVGIFFAAVVPTLYAALSKRVPPDSKSGVMGIASSATLMGSLTGFLTCGVIAASYGMEMTFVVSASVLLLVAILSGKPKKIKLSSNT